MTAKTISKAIFIVILALSVVFSTTVYADVGDRYKVHEDGNWFAMGGINQFEGVKAQSREETQNMEANLIAKDYLLCSTNDMMITDAEYMAFISYYRPFWFSEYMANEPFNWTKIKVYIYKPCFVDFIEQLETQSVKEYTRDEINNSTVVLNYAIWDDVEKVGTISDEYNDNIPEWYKSGYMEIRSPVDCSIKFWHSDSNRYYVFYISKDNPFLIKVRQGFYHLVEINSLEVNNNVDDAGEETLPYNNQILIYDNCTYDNPYVIDLYNLCNKYNVKDIDISGKPDLSIDQNQDIPDAPSTDVDIDKESTIVQDDDKKDSEPDSFSWRNLILWIVIGLAIVGVVVYEIREIKKKEDDSEEDDE